MCACIRAARFRDLRVAADVIRVHTRVDDELDWFRRCAVDAELNSQLMDGGEHFIGHLGRSGIDEEHAIRAGRNGDVAARADQHVDILADREYVDVGADLS